MDTQIESDLRAALAARAAELDDPGAMVLARDYRPRGGVPRMALAGGGAVAAVGAVAVILTVGLSTDTPRAFAGWSPTPTTASMSQTQSAEAACRARLPTSAAIEHAQETASGPRGGPRKLPRIATGGWQTTLTDVRGPYTLTLFTAAEGQAVLSCFSGRNTGEVSLGGAFDIHPLTAVSAGQISVRTSGSNVTPPDEGSAEFSRLVGRVGPGVTAVTLRLSDSTQVTASTADGWFIAWWPGTAQASAAEITTSNGTTTQPIGAALGGATATASSSR
jgi:hypothetical protein